MENMQNREIREKLARITARFFLLHLKAELTKPKSLAEHVTLEGITFRELTERMIAALCDTYPQLEEDPPAPYNLFERWWNAMSVPVDYSQTTFKLYNQTFFVRLQDIREGSRKSKARLRAQVQDMLGKSKFHEKDLTFQIIYTGESCMYEQLREIVTNNAELPARETWPLIMAQNQFINAVTFEHFDSALKESLKRSDDLLKNILPGPIAAELKANGQVAPVQVDDASVMFADIEGFTRIAELLAPRELMAELDRCFSHFDAIMRQRRLEKIKTIGDCYMCAGGVLERNNTHPADAVLCAVRIQEFMRKYKKSRQRRGLPCWELRIGIHSGPLVAGVIGLHRLNFDIWGDTVNVASRIQDSCEPGRVNISPAVEERVRDLFVTEYRGKFSVKNKGEMDMYHVTGIRPEFSLQGNGRVPNRRFLDAVRTLACTCPVRGA